MTEGLLTPSKVSAWLDCDHYLTLRRQVDAGILKAAHPPFGSLARLLADKGITHETDCLAEFRKRGLTVHEVPKWRDGESFADWVERIGNPLDSRPDVIYQMPLIHDGMRGIADFLVTGGARSRASAPTNPWMPSWPARKRSPGMCSSSASTPKPPRPGERSPSTCTSGSGRGTSSR